MLNLIKKIRRALAAGPRCPPIIWPGVTRRQTRKGKTNKTDVSCLGNSALYTAAAEQRSLESGSAAIPHGEFLPSVPTSLILMVT